MLTKGLMSNVPGGTDDGLVAQLGCCLRGDGGRGVGWVDQVIGEGFLRSAWETRPLQEIRTQWRILCPSLL